MKNNKKFIGLAIMGMIFGGSMAGYASEIKNTSSVNVENYQQLTITSDAHNVVVQETDGNKITASMNGYKGRLLKKDGKKLSINIPAPKAGIRLSDPDILYVKVPKNNHLNINVQSEAGNVTLDHVSGKKIKVDLQAGKITANNLPSKIQAKTEIGEIKAKSTPEKVTQTQTGGAVYKDTQTNNSDSVTTLHNETGEIEIN